MLKKFCNDKYKNDLTTHVGDFLESLLVDEHISALNGGYQLQVKHTGSVLEDSSAAGLSARALANSQKA
ncbi:hypothetical protein [Pedobacter gandavensis]|uniref:hypothetical protein n=1 Tax=Pedobacter gandavensis TaxID=2679963 RepID=UPI0029316757|nr:hypothetical protein [Pedobacter gandavensis]